MTPGQRRKDIDYIAWRQPLSRVRLGTVHQQHAVDAGWNTQPCSHVRDGGAISDLDAG